MYNIVKWEEYLNMLEKHLNISPKNIDDYFEMCPNEDDIKWYQLKNWETRSDIDILSEVFDGENDYGNLYVITEATSSKIDGVIEVSQNNLKNFVKTHREMFKERFFNGDTLIISINKKNVWMLHHEGVYAKIIYGS